MQTLNNQLITNNKVAITNNTIEYSNRKGFVRRYSILGLYVNVETTKERGWNRYETRLQVGSTNHYSNYDKEFNDWYLDVFKLSIGIKSFQNFKSPITYAESIERHTQSRLENAHANGILASESFVLQIINKYIEILFTQVNNEVITRQIDELKSQLVSTN